MSQIPIGKSLVRNIPGGGHSMCKGLDEGGGGSPGGSENQGPGQVQTEKLKECIHIFSGGGGGGAGKSHSKRL